MLLSQMKIHPSYISFVSFYYEFHYFLLFRRLLLIIGLVTSPLNANLGIFWAFILNVNAPREGVYFVFCLPIFDFPEKPSPQSSPGMKGGAPIPPKMLDEDEELLLDEDELLLLDNELKLDEELDKELNEEILLLNDDNDGIELLEDIDIDDLIDFDDGMLNDDIDFPIPLLDKLLI